MDITQLFSFILVATLLVISPGPNGVLIAKTVSMSGRAAGFANIGGFVLAFYIHGTLSILGISLLLVQSAQAFFVVKVVGALYLFWLGIKSLRAAWVNDQRPVDIVPVKQKVSTKSAFFEGFLTNLLNPKVSMFYLAAFPQFTPVADISTAYVLVFLHSLINLLWFSAMVILLSRMRSIATSRMLTRWLKSVTGVVFIFFGTKLALLKM